MKNLFGLIVVLVVLIVAVGFWRGWFEVNSQKEENGNVRANLNVDMNKFEQDKLSFKKLLAEKSSALKRKLQDLQEKHKGTTGAAKAKLDQEIEVLKKKNEKLEEKLKAVEQSGKEKFDEIKKSFQKENDDSPSQDEAPTQTEPQPSGKSE
jgi:chromosome segregation ATPase